MSATIKPWLVLAVIFIAGILTGTALTVVLYPHFEKPPFPRDLRQHWMERLTEKLKLTQDQQAKIQPILADASTQMQALHHDELQRGAQIFKATDERISTLLTPDQQVLLQEMKKEREKAFAGHLHLWGSMHGGPDGGPPPPPPPSPPLPEPATNAPPPGQ
jgi:Spy/CpxP family protein refolding chaperone